MSPFFGFYDSACKMVEDWMVNMNLDLHWTWYRFLYPPKTDKFDPNAIEELIAKDLFPTFKTLAPFLLACLISAATRRRASSRMGNPASTLKV